MSTTDAVGVAVGVVTLVGAGAGLWLKARKKWRHSWDRIIGALETIAGRPEIVDRATGRVLVPAQDGMATRITRVEDGQTAQGATLAQMAQAMQKLADGLQQQQALVGRVDDHDERIAKLELAAVERVVARAESAAAFQAIDTAIRATPDVEGDAEKATD